jgi:hypothetical protein
MGERGLRKSLALLLGVCAGAALAQERAGLPSAAGVIDGYVKALGGAEALRKAAARAWAGSFESPTYGSFGFYEEYVRTPDRLLRRIRVPDYGVVERGFDGVRGWSESPEYGREDLAGARLAEMRRDASVDQPLEWKDLYSKLAVSRRTRVEDRDAFEVEATAPDGAVEKLFFDTRTGLLLRRESRETFRGGDSRLVCMDYEDYRAVNGIQAAHRLRYVSDDLIWIVRRTLRVE